MKRFFKRLILAGLTDKKPEYTTPLWFSILVTLFLFGVWFFLLVIVESITLKSLISIVAIVFFILFFLRQYNQGYIHGATYALKNPRTGETNFQITDGISDDGKAFILWQSETFVPNPVLPGPMTVDPKKIEVPSRYADWQKWRDAYFLTIVPMIQENKNQGEIIAELGKQGYPASEKSYYKIRKAGDVGKLDKWG